MTFFSELRFPEDISYGSLGGPQFSTTVVMSKNGYEHRNINWEYGRVKYNVAYGIKSSEQLDKLISFFRIHQGRAVGFRFKDWTDYKVINQKLAISTAPDAGQELPIIKSYKEGEKDVKRRIFKPVKGTIMIKNGTELLPDDSFVVNCETGVVQLLAQNIQPEKLYITCEFDVPMRFESDYLPCRLEDYNFYNVRDVDLIEIKF